jgi:hypothetical protein
MKQTSSRLGDGFDESLQVTEDRDRIFDESDIGRDEGRPKLKSARLCLQSGTELVTISCYFLSVIT